MGKQVAETNMEKIRSAHAHARGVQGLEWRVSPLAVSVFSSLVDFVHIHPLASRYGTVPTDCFGMMVRSGTGAIAVVVDKSQPDWICQLVGDDFEASLELRPNPINADPIWS